MVIQGAHHFDARQYAVVAIELAAGGLGIDMAARDDRRQGVVAAGAAHKAVADLVDDNRHAGFFGPGDHQITALFVEVGQGQTAHTTLGRGADLGQFHQRGPQAVAVDAQLVDAFAGGFVNHG